MPTSLKSVLGGSGAGFKLAPDLSYISDRVSNTSTSQSVTIDPRGSLTTALSLSGKFYLAGMIFSNLTNGENCALKLTIDGEVIINDSFTITVGDSILSLRQDDMPVVCNSSLILEFQSTTSSSVIFSYIARPIL